MMPMGMGMPGMPQGAPGMPMGMPQGAPGGIMAMLVQMAQASGMPPEMLAQQLMGGAPAMPMMGGNPGMQPMMAPMMPPAPQPGYR